MKTFKIAVTGTHSTGKTTFVEFLGGKLRDEGLTVATVSDLGEECLNKGFRILYDHTPQSTLWIMSTGITRELEAALTANVIIVDRPVPDALGYFNAAMTYRDEASPANWADYLATLAGMHASTYDMIFSSRLDPLIPLGTNKERDRDGRFRLLADEAVADVLMDLGISAHALTPGNHDAAAALVLERVRERRTAGDATATIPTQADPVESLVGTD